MRILRFIIIAVICTMLLIPIAGPVGQRLEALAVYGPIVKTRTTTDLALEDGRLYANSISEIAVQLDLKLKSSETAGASAH
jgi:hypothetical protein